MLPNDIARCTGDNCPLIDNCQRHADPIDSERQVWFMHPPWDREAKTCEYQIPVATDEPNAMD